MDTQLPFPYVHLITFIVNVQNLTLAVKCGAAFAVAMAQNNIEVMIGQVIIVLLVGTVCQGLLSISYVVQDPFGEDLLDLPLNHFARYVAQSCLAMERAATACPGLEDMNLEELASDGRNTVNEKTAPDLKVSNKTASDVKVSANTTESVPDHQRRGCARGTLAHAEEASSSPARTESAKIVVDDFVEAEGVTAGPLTRGLTPRVG